MGTILCWTFHPKALTFIQQQIPETKTDPDTAVGDLYYIGYGKFAQKFRSGTAESDYQALMWLNRRELKKSTTLDTDLTTGTKINALDIQPSEENGYRQYITYNGHQLELAPTRYASMDDYMNFYNVTLMNPRVLCGMFSGVLLAFLFCSLTMQAVGRAAYQMMLECRKQFGQIKEYLKSKGHDQAYADDCANWPRGQVEFNNQRIPDYAACVEISTQGAQREMIFPSLLAIILPVLVGLILGVPGVMGMLAGGLTSGFAVAIFMANAGGAWDNAKKYVEMGHHGGKGSDAHKAAVVGDTVGDPFKDTSGPSLNILIKLMSMVSVVFAGLVVKYAPAISEFLHFGN